jgi:16S rRNA (guanine527-N7)-methyltransferase
MSKRIIPTSSDLKLLQTEFHVSRESIELLQIYVDLLVEWQKKTNLVSNSSLDEIWRRHICDSIQCRAIFPNKLNWLDIGTGAGFPGLVLSILARNESEFVMNLVESNNKKCAFLRKVIRETGAMANVTANRIESVAKQFQSTDVVTARALSSLDKLLLLTQSWLNSGAVGLFLKGRDYSQELVNCRGSWEFDLLVHNSRIEENSVLLEIQNLKKLEI